MAKVKRSYSSPRRAVQALRTRRSILEAARQLFVESGYGATTLQQIADTAGVAVQTIYASFGNKQTVLAELLDVSIAGDDQPIAVNDREWMQIVFNDPDPATRIGAYAAAVAGIYDRAGTVFHVLQAAAHSDAAVAPLAQQTDARRRTGAASVIAGLDGIGALDPELTTVQATHILWTLNSPDHYHRLVINSGWQLTDYQGWLDVTMTRCLVNSEHPKWSFVGENPCNE